MLKAIRFIRFLLCILFTVVFIDFGLAQAPSERYKPIVLDPSYEHDKWGTEPREMVYQFAAYTSSFDSNDDDNGDGIGDTWGIPTWVAYEVKRKNPQLPDPSYNRPSKWLTDTQQHALGVVPDDETYHVSGTRDLKEVKSDYRYVRGHLCPKNTADRISMEAGYNTHSILNCVPQLQWQNNGIWKALEQDVEQWADKEGRIWVVCGPVFFDRNPAVWLGQGSEVKAAVPDALFKIVIKQDQAQEISTLAFIFPNVLPKSEKEYSEFMTSIDRIEVLTGLDFLSRVPDSISTIIEAKGEHLTDDEKKEIVEGWF